MWNRQAAELRRQVAALQEQVAEVRAAREADQQRQDEAGRAIAALVAEHREDALRRVAELAARVDAAADAVARMLSADDLSDQLKPIKVEIARIARQTTADQQQVQRACIEMLDRIKRVESRGTVTA